MLQALAGLNYLFGIGSLICLILVIIKMIQNGQTALGIVSIFCGIIAFVVGWQNANNWGIKNVMLIWTICFIANIVIGGAVFSMTPIQIPNH